MLIYSRSEENNLFFKILEPSPKKYPKEIKGEVKTNKSEYDWANIHAPKYSIIITMKNDKELAKN